MDTEDKLVEWMTVLFSRLTAQGVSPDVLARVAIGAAVHVLIEAGEQPSTVGEVLRRKAAEADELFAPQPSSALN